MRQPGEDLLEQRAGWCLVDSDELAAILYGDDLSLVGKDDVATALQEGPGLRVVGQGERTCLLALSSDSG